MSTEGVDTLDYLTDELLWLRYAEETERLADQALAIERTGERQQRLADALVARGIW